MKMFARSSGSDVGRCERSSESDEDSRTTSATLFLAPGTAGGGEVRRVTSSPDSCPTCVRRVGCGSSSFRKYHSAKEAAAAVAPSASGRSRLLRRERGAMVVVNCAKGRCSGEKRKRRGWKTCGVGGGGWLFIWWLDELSLCLALLLQQVRRSIPELTCLLACFARGCRAVLATT